MKPTILSWDLPGIPSSSQMLCCHNWNALPFQVLSSCLSVTVSFHEFSCWEQKERLFFGIRKVINQDHCYAGSQPPFISRHLYFCWRSKHLLHATSWTQGNYVCCLTSRIQLHICHAIKGDWGDKNHHRTGCYPRGTCCNLPVTTIFHVVAAHLYKSSCVLLLGQLASRDVPVKPCILCMLSLVQNLVSKRYEYTHN